MTRRRTSDSWVWRLIGQIDHEPDGSWMAPMAGQMEDKAQGPEGRLTFMMGRLKKKGMTNISFTRKQDPDL